MTPLRLTQLGIKRLHTAYDVSISIRDDRTVLVGVNGLGKTTIINILYRLLSRQWDRLLDFEFSELTVEIQGQCVTLPRSHIKPGLYMQRALRRAFRRYMPLSVLTRIERDPRWISWLQEEPKDWNALRRLMLAADIPRSMIERVVADLGENQMTLFEPALAEEAKEFKQVDKILSQLNVKVLYLPTYRRIEKDLKTILPNLEEHIREYNRTATARAERSREHIEFVEFGMEDVEEQFRHVFAALKDDARTELNNLAGSYLREVIRGEAETYDRAIHTLTDEDISNILGRVEEKTISDNDKVLLKAAIARLRSAFPDGAMPDRDKYIAHFFSRLADIHQSLTAKEASISRFVDVVNRYLYRKSLIFDEKAYRIYVKLDRGSEIPMSSLSSGEKQIVSLFSHLYLGSGSRLCILIDEPELSLSVEWQKMLLPDILKSERCIFLAATTHSPFIFDNDLEMYASDLRECIKDV